MRRRTWLLFLLFVAAGRAEAVEVFAALKDFSGFDRYQLNFSATPDVASIAVCEANVRWPCAGGRGRFRPLDRINGPSERSWFASYGDLLLWDKKKLYLQVRYLSGRQSMEVIQFKQLSRDTEDLSDRHIGDAKPNEALLDKECVFATSPVPRPNARGERGETYPTHRTSRDYSLRDHTPLYSMGTCKVVKRIDSPTEHPCGIGVAMRCLLKGQVMGVLYCHLESKAVDKKYFGIGEFVGYSGHTGTDDPHLHLGMTHLEFDPNSPLFPGAEEEELLMPGRPVRNNNPDRWLAENNCYQDPKPNSDAPPALSSGKSSTRRPDAESASEWDGLSFQGNQDWSLEVGR